jgi:hypothetical protein
MHSLFIESHNRGGCISSSGNSLTDRIRIGSRSEGRYELFKKQNKRRLGHIYGSAGRLLAEDCPDFLRWLRSRDADLKADDAAIVPVCTLCSIVAPEINAVT